MPTSTKAALFIRAVIVSEMHYCSLLSSDIPQRSPIGITDSGIADQDYRTMPKPRTGKPTYNNKRCVFV